MPEEKEYADFGDLEKSPIPDEVEEVNSEDNHLAISYEKSEESGETQTKEEDLSHLVNPDGSIKEEATDEQMEKLGVDNPKSYRYFQSQLHKAQQKKEPDQDYEALQREIQQLRGELNPKPVEQPLVKPQKPNSDDPLDLIKWQTEMFDYQEKLLEKQQQQFNQVNESWQQAEQRRQQEQQYAQLKAYHIGKLQEKGLSPEEAMEAFTVYSKAQENPDQYYADLSEFYRFKKGQYATPKGKNMDNRVTRQGQVPSLANVPSKTEPQKGSPDDEFFGDMNNFIKQNY